MRENVVTTRAVEPGASVTTYADGFGIWHATVKDELSANRAYDIALDAIQHELDMREKPGTVFLKTLILVESRANRYTFREGDYIS